MPQTKSEQNSRGRLCASLRSRKAARILTKNAASQTLAARFVRDRAVKMHMDISQEPFHAEILR